MITGVTPIRVNSWRFPPRCRRTAGGRPRALMTGGAPLSPRYAGGSSPLAATAAYQRALALGSRRCVA
jgi:hypothetical protein